MLPLLAVGGGLLQGALGFLGAKKKQKEAKRMEEENRQANILNQAWTGMLGQKPMLQEQFEKPSALAAGLQGAMGGALQGVNVYQGLETAKANKAKLLDQLRGKDLEEVIPGGRLPTHPSFR